MLAEQSRRTEDDVCACVVHEQHRLAVLVTAHGGGEGTRAALVRGVRHRARKVGGHGALSVPPCLIPLALVTPAPSSILFITLDLAIWRPRHTAAQPSPRLQWPGSGWGLQPQALLQAIAAGREAAGRPWPPARPRLQKDALT